MIERIALIVNEIDKICNKNQRISLEECIKKLKELGILTIYLETLDKKHKTEDIYITKQKENAFIGTDLKDILLKNEIKTVIICGAKDGISLETTATDAYFNEFGVVIMKDGIFSEDSKDLSDIMEWFKRYYGTILNFQEIQEQLIKTKTLIVEDFDLP